MHLDTWSRVHIRQTKDHTMYAFMVAVVIISVLLSDEARASRVDTCDVQPMCVYIQHFIYSLCASLSWVGVTILLVVIPHLAKDDQIQTSIVLLYCVVELSLVALVTFAIVAWQLEDCMALPGPLYFCCLNSDAS